MKNKKVLCLRLFEMVRSDSKWLLAALLFVAMLPITQLTAQKPEAQMEEIKDLLYDLKFHHDSLYQDLYQEVEAIKAAQLEANKVIEADSPAYRFSREYLQQYMLKNREVRTKLIEEIDHLERGLYMETQKLNQAEANLRDIYRSQVNHAFQVERFDNSFSCYIADLTSSDVQFFWRSKRKTKYRSIKNLKLDLERYRETLIFATNAGMYTSTGNPQGLYVEDGIEYVPIDLKTKGYGNFYMQPNGVFLIDANGEAAVIPSDEYLPYAKTVGIEYATQSGPMLLNQGEVNSHFTPGSKNLNIRSGIGIIDANKVVFIISDQEVNFYDFARLFKDYFGCEQALYLDGAISQMYLPQIKRFEMGGSFGPMIGIIEKQKIK